jgi:hypothetical protein
MVDIVPTVFLDVIRIHYPTEPGPYAQNSQPAILWIIICDIGYVITSGAWLRVVPFFTANRVQIWRHCEA